jgi:hypothetical protein
MKSSVCTVVCWMLLHFFQLKLCAEGGLTSRIIFLTKVRRWSSTLMVRTVLYVTRTFRSVQQSNRPLLRCIPPRLTPSLWNVHDATANSDPRTNNQYEGWNNKFKHIVGHKHPSVSCDQVPERRALVCISQGEGREGMETAIQAWCQPSGSSRWNWKSAKEELENYKQVYRDLQDRLQNLCVADGEKSLEIFLWDAGRNIRLGDNWISNWTHAWTFKVVRSMFFNFV